MPLVNELVQRKTIGDYYVLDMDMSERPADALSGEHPAHFWKEFNKAAAEGKLLLAELDRKGLPTNLSAACYQSLFTLTLPMSCLQKAKQ